MLPRTPSYKPGTEGSCAAQCSEVTIWGPTPHEVSGTVLCGADVMVPSFGQRHGTHRDAETRASGPWR